MKKKGGGSEIYLRLLFWKLYTLTPKIAKLSLPTKTKKEIKMDPILERALEVLNQANINIEEGLSNPNDKDKAKEIFKKLRKYGVILLKTEIKSWAVENGWSERHADELGSLAQQIGEGRRVILRSGPYWLDNIIENLASQIESDCDF